MQRLFQWNVLILLVVNLNARFHPPVVPIDSEGYVKSFTFSRYDSPEAFDARTFFEKLGFVVIANVFTPEQCANTISDIWNVIESIVGVPLRYNGTLWTSEQATSIFDQHETLSLLLVRNWMNTRLPKMGFLVTRACRIGRHLPYMLPLQLCSARIIF